VADKVLLNPDTISRDRLFTFLPLSPRVLLCGLLLLLQGTVDAAGSLDAKDYEAGGKVIRTTPIPSGKKKKQPVSRSQIRKLPAVAERESLAGSRG
jgi:hypothetical protein